MRKQSTKNKTVPLSVNTVYYKAGNVLFPSPYSGHRASYQRLVIYFAARQLELRLIVMSPIHGNYQSQLTVVKMKMSLCSRNEYFHRKEYIKLKSVGIERPYYFVTILNLFPRNGCLKDRH